MRIAPCVAVALAVLWGIYSAPSPCQSLPAQPEPAATPSSPSANEQAFPEHWKTLDQAALTELGRKLKGNSSTISDQYKLFVTFVEKKFADAGAAGNVDMKAWRELCLMVNKALSLQARRSMVAAMKFDPSDAKLSAADMVGMAQLLALLDSRAMTAKAAAFEEELDRRAKAAPLECMQLATVAHIWLLLGDKPKAQVWAVKAYEAAFATPKAQAAMDVTSLNQLGYVFNQVGLDGKAVKSAPLATTIADLAQRGEFDMGADWWPYYLLSRIAATDQDRDIMRSKLIDKDGNPSWQLACVIACSYRRADKFNEWQDFLDGQLVDASLSPDARAQWLLVRAWAESVSEFNRHPRLGAKWLDQVLTLDCSTALKVRAVAETARGHAIEHEYDKAMNYVEEVAKKFPASQKELALLRGEICQLTIEYCLRWIPVLQKRIETMQDMAAKAEQQGDKNGSVHLRGYIEPCRAEQGRYVDLLDRANKGMAALESRAR